MQLNLDTLFLAIFVVIAGTLIVSMLKNGGFKGAMFGARIKKTLGEVVGSSSKVGNRYLRIHQLDSSPERAVGIEFVAKSIGSYQMTPITLSVKEARRLNDILRKAIDE